jgi:hypothetical protein
MRASIPHPLRDRLAHPLRRIPRRMRERRHSRWGRSRPGAASSHAVTPSPRSGPSRSGPSDLAVERVRDAGGPVDRASYSCECGYVFLAPVSTTVTCPHCQAGQAW